ncbi:GPW/gp25 family protein [Gynuella sp.]|uniref:GPW/gp25 family protein n=1 Tax=Gynuella sp. TaxID=2969146 RepID=UPI003D11B016
MSLNQLIGSGWGFPPRFQRPSTGPAMQEDEALIQQSLFIMLNTRTGERLHNTAYGCNLKDYLFQPTDAETLTDIKEDIARSISQYEKRVTLEEITFNTDNLYDGLLNIQLSYRIKSTNQAGNLVFPFYLTEG